MTVSYIDFQNGSDTANPLGTEAAPRKTDPTIVDNMVLRYKRGSSYFRAGQRAFSAQGVIVTDYGNPEAPRPIFNSIHAASTSSFNVTGDIIFANIDFNVVDRTGTETSASSVGQNVVALNRRGGGAAGTPVVSGVFVGCGFNQVGNNAINCGSISDADYADAAPVLLVLACDFDTLGNDAVYGSVGKYFEAGWCTAKNFGTRADSNSDFINLIACDTEYAWIHDNYVDHTTDDRKHLIVLDMAAGRTGGLAVIERNVLIGYGANAPYPQATLNAGINSEMRAIVRNNYIRGSRLLTVISSNGLPGSQISANIFDYTGSGNGAQCMSVSGANCTIDQNTFYSRNRLTDARAIAFSSSATGARLSRNLFVGFDKTVTTTSQRGFITGGNNRFASCATRYWDQTNSVDLADGTDDTSYDATALGALYGPSVVPPSGALNGTMTRLDRRVPDFWGRFAPEGVGYIGALMERGI